LQREIAGRYRRGLVGRTLRVIVEESRAARRGLTRGTGRVALAARSEFDAPDIDGRVLVRWPAAAAVRPSPGDFIDVRVVQSSAYTVVGVPVDGPG
jgi:tRNA A37 methylthiotransferase MiaB